MFNIAKPIKLIKILQKSYYLKALLQHRVAGGVEHSRLLDYLQMQNIQTLVDVGANRGQFALVARTCFPNAKIISFEPLKEPAAIFRNVFRSDPMVVLHEIAIGPDENEVPMHVSCADDSSSLLPISVLQNNLFPGTAEKELRTIKVKPLDAILSSKDIQTPALLKIDVQGFEREALLGCKSLLACFSSIYVECSFMKLYTGQALAPEIIDLLDGWGFALCGVYNLCYDKKGVAIQGDFLFKKK